MKTVALLAVLIVALAGNADCKRTENEFYPRENGVLVLDDHSFFAALMKYKFVLVFFFGKDKESKDAEKVMTYMEETLDKSNPDIHVAKVNTEKELEIQRKFPLFQLPMVMLFKNGRRFDYHGKITNEHIDAWVKLAMNVPLIINIPKELEDLREETCVVVGCFPGKKPDDAFKNFYQVSEYFVYDPKMTLPRFAVVTSAQIARTLSLTSGSVSVYKKFEDGNKEVFKGDASNFNELLKFVDYETVPVVYKHNQIGYNHRIYDTGKIYQHLLFMSSKDRNYQETFSNFKEAARKFQTNDSKVVFVHVDTAHEDSRQSLNFYHIDTTKELPCNRMTKVDKYHSRFKPPRSDFSTDAFTKFTSDVMEGRVDRSIRSDEPPTDWNMYDVKVIVGSTYDNYIHDKTRVVFMMYYVPNDDASDSAQGVYNQVAKDMRSNKTITFGKMNVATNDGEIDVHIKYPSFKMFRTNGESVKYLGNVDVGSIKAFIETNGANQVLTHSEDEGGAEYDSSWHDQMHPIDTVKDEEERRAKWEAEEKEFLAKAVLHQEGEQAHDDPRYKEEHPTGEHHEDGSETDPEKMNVKEHADFENHDYNLERDQHYEL